MATIKKNGNQVIGNTAAPKKIIKKKTTEAVEEKKVVNKVKPATTKVNNTKEKEPTVKAVAKNNVKKEKYDNSKTVIMPRATIKDLYNEINAVLKENNIESKDINISVENMTRVVLNSLFNIVANNSFRYAEAGAYFKTTTTAVKITHPPLATGDVLISPHHKVTLFMSPDTDKWTGELDGDTFVGYDSSITDPEEREKAIEEIKVSSLKPNTFARIETNGIELNNENSYGPDENPDENEEEEIEEVTPIAKKSSKKISKSKNTVEEDSDSDDDSESEDTEEIEEEEIEEVKPMKKPIAKKIASKISKSETVEEDSDSDDDSESEDTEDDEEDIDEDEINFDEDDDAELNFDEDEDE